MKGPELPLMTPDTLGVKKAEAPTLQEETPVIPGAAKPRTTLHRSLAGQPTNGRSGSGSSDSARLDSRMAVMELIQAA